MNWTKMLARHGEASNVVARYWYVKGVNKTTGDTDVFHEHGTMSFHSVRSVRYAKKRMRKQGKHKRVCAVLVTVRRVPKGGPKTIPSHRMPPFSTGVVPETKPFQGYPKTTEEK